MSPTPVTFDSPTAPGDLQLGGDRRGGRRALRRDPSSDRPVRPQHLARPAGARRQRLLAAGRFEAPLSEYPPSDYRRLVEAAAARYGVTTDELLVGAGADEILDIVAKAFLPAGGAAVVPVPTYAMYRVADRAARRRGRRGPATRRGRGLGARPRGDRAPPPRTPRSSGCAARTTRPRWPSRTARSRRCSPGSPRTPPRRAGPPRSSSSTRRTPSSSGRRCSGSATTTRTSIVVRTASKAYALAGLRVGFAVARPELIARINPYRPPGSVSTVSVTLVTEALLDPTRSSTTTSPASPASGPACATRSLALGWSVGPSVTNFLLVDFGSAERAAAVAEALLAHGLVPRTFGGGPSAGRPPAPDRPRPGRERPAHRGRRRRSATEATAHDHARSVASRSVRARAAA